MYCLVRWQFDFSNIIGFWHAKFIVLFFQFLHDFKKNLPLNFQEDSYLIENDYSTLIAAKYLRKG